jgi:ABC-type multidrug transport system fused ATPase/permease subunit
MYYGGGSGGGSSMPGGPQVMQRLQGVVNRGFDAEVPGKIYDARVVRRIPKYVAWVKWFVAVGGTGTLLRTTASLAIPYVVAIATDSYIKAGNLSGLNGIALIYLGAIALMWAGQYMETLFFSYAGQGILLRLRTEIFEHLHKLSMSFFDHNKAGAVMSVVQNDVDQIQILLTQDIINIGADVLSLIGMAVIMIIMNLRLALITLSIVLVLGIALFVWQKFALRAFMKVRRTVAVVNDELQEGISGVRVTQNLSREGVNQKQFDAANKANRNANIQAAKLQAVMMPTVQILTNCGFALVLVFGGSQVLAGTMQIGVLIAFLLYIQRLFAPVQELVMMYTELEVAMAAGIHIFELLDVKPDIEDSPQATELPPIKGEVKFNHVSFGYDHSAEVLHDIDFTIKPGETVAIAGQTGAGKSSLTSLIARFYEAQKGEVLVDGQNVNSVTQQSLRSQIGIVPQDPFLFSGTVEGNIRYGRPDASHEEVVRAAEAAGAYDFITRLERGLDTQVGERGGNLSAGQRQLVCLARAILTNPPILILDEATSSVDTNTERIMQASLRRLAKDRTCVIIAHRLSTVIDADRIVVLDHGKIAETGSHQELMAKQGLYYDMFQTLSAPGL